MHNRVHLPASLLLSSSSYEENMVRTHQSQARRPERYDERVSRMRILSKALEDGGCSIREDSKLCKAFVELGYGDVDVIVKIMQEMKFYFERTEYEAIFDALHETAEREFEYALFEWEEGGRKTMRPRFYAYFDQYEASDLAKERALDGYLQKFMLVVGDATKHETTPGGKHALQKEQLLRLPATLRQTVLVRFMAESFSTWLAKNLPDARAPTRAYAHVLLQLLFPSLTEIEDTSEAAVEANLGSVLRAYDARERRREDISASVDAWLSDADAGRKGPFALRLKENLLVASEAEEQLKHWTPAMLETAFGLARKREVERCECPSFAEYLSSYIIPNPENNTNTVTDDDDIHRVMEKLRETEHDTNGIWHCNLCQFKVADATSIVSHSMRKHRAKRASEVLAHLV